MSEKRFVFLVQGSEDEVLKDTTLEFRCASLDDATKRALEAGERWKCGMRLIGVREGFKSTARFLSFVSKADLPDYVKQNERVEYIFAVRLVHSDVDEVLPLGRVKSLYRVSEEEERALRAGDRVVLEDGDAVVEKVA